MAIGHITLRVNPSIQQELDSLAVDSYADDYWKIGRASCRERVFNWV